ncbi:DUF4136 domain-containing protein [Formosa sp. S-31]|uniref:DUF4136 domain-containing protein n=1 Tax=Formosa sp. S-31 TaxID=2790949 RepID=UPI003EBD1EC2
MKGVTVVLVILVLYGCTSVNVVHDYDRNVNFQNYKTYNYYSGIQGGMSDLDIKRLIQALDSGLETKGFYKSESPDFLINVSGIRMESDSRNTVGVGIGGSGGNIGGGISFGIPLDQNQRVHKLLVEFVDPEEVGLFWQAEAEFQISSNTTPEKKLKTFQALTEKLLSGFPPNTNN